MKWLDFNDRAVWYHPLRVIIRLTEKLCWYSISLIGHLVWTLNSIIRVRIIWTIWYEPYHMARTKLRNFLLDFGQWKIHSTTSNFTELSFYTFKMVKYRSSWIFRCFIHKDISVNSECFYTVQSLHSSIVPRYLIIWYDLYDINYIRWTSIWKS